MLRRRLWLRRLAWAASCAACWLLGVLAAQAWRPAPASPRSPGPTAEVAVAPAPQPETPAPPTAVALEWQAFDSAAPAQAALYLTAGNRYFEEMQDYESALRCYRQALAAGDARLLEVRPEDNWLVAALKLDRNTKEN